MKKSYLLLLASLSALGLFSCQQTSEEGSEDFTQYVEPRIGTAHCRYFHFAPGALPFGMAKPGPSTNGHMGNKDGWEASGYDYRDETIEGFPCVHEFQVGGITLMPVVGEVKASPVEYCSHFSHGNEVVQPGYYSVLLDDYGVKAEVTATTRVAYERFTFPESAESRILFNIGSRMGESGAVKDASVKVNDDGSIEGYVVTLPEYVKKYQPGAEVPIYFYAELDKAPTACRDIYFVQLPNPIRGEREARQPAAPQDITEAHGVGAGLCLTFDTKAGEQVTAKVGISYTSVENARKNLEEEGDDGFDAVKREAIAEWNEHLGRIAVETDNREDKVKFYSGLYHALLGRGICSDCSGDYPRHDGGVGRVPVEADGNPKYNMYNTDAMWGGQWNLTQVWAMAYPEHLSDFISSHLQVYRDAGWLGDGLANSRYVSGVGTNQLSLMIAAAYACGIRDFDLELAYEACRKNELDGENRPLGAGKSDTDQFVANGYVPHAETGDGPDETFMFSASHTLEYSFSAWATAQLAKALGHDEDVEKLLWLSKGWERIYDAETNFVRPRLKDGR